MAYPPAVDDPSRRVPLLRRCPARDALEAPLERQVARLHHEAGVRDQL